MEKGVCNTWTPALEEFYKSLLTGPLTFAERHLIMSMRDLLKYDHRTKAGKRAVAQGRLRMMTATDEDLEQMAKLEVKMAGDSDMATLPEVLEGLKRTRARIREKGIKRSELACR